MFIRLTLRTHFICPILFISYVVLNKISTFLFNTMEILNIFIKRARLAALPT